MTLSVLNLEYFFLQFIPLAKSDIIEANLGPFNVGVEPQRKVGQKFKRPLDHKKNEAYRPMLQKFGKQSTEVCPVLKIKYP